jgi:hypothetical protein
MSEMIQHLLFFYKYGGKQLYYYNTYDGQGEIDVSDGTEAQLEAGAVDDEDCDSCTI